MQMVEDNSDATSFQQVQQVREDATSQSESIMRMEEDSSVSGISRVQELAAKENLYNVPAELRGLGRD